MSTFKRLVCQLLIAVLAFPATPRAQASAYDAHPKLVVLLVIDQFRGDYLDRYRADFKGRGFRLFLDHGAYFEDCYYDYANTKTAPGHATLGTGAYTDGHGISSNSWWDLARNKQRPVSSVEDDRYKLLGVPNPKESSEGASPMNLRASTVGDELRLATQGQSKVFGISLKDRAAILPAGYSANGAYWIDENSGYFITSTYYMSGLPGWLNQFNTSGRIAQAQQEAGTAPNAPFYASVGRTPAANAYELDFARALIEGEQLGRHSSTDMLTISLSANDLLGHAVGPDSPDEREMIDALDQQLDSFFTWLDKNIPGGLPNVWITLSADHGVAPLPSLAAMLGLPAAGIDLTKLIASLNDTMNAKFSPGEKVEYVLAHQELPYLSLNQPSFDVAGINELEAEQAIQQAVPAAVASLAPPVGETPQPGSDNPSSANPSSGNPANGNPGNENSGSPEKSAAEAVTLPANAAQQPNTPVNPNPPPKPRPPQSTQHRRTRRGAKATQSAPPAPVLPPAAPPVRLPAAPVIVHVYTRQQLAGGELPPSEWGLLMAHSYSPNGGWYVMLVPAAYQMESLKSGTTHFSAWSYDRHVPLGFYGGPFTPGIYYDRVQPVDLAATLAALLGVNQPSAAIGTVLTQAIHVVAPATEKRIVRHSSASRAAEGETEQTRPAGPASPAPAPHAAPATAAPQDTGPPSATTPAPTTTPPSSTSPAPASTAPPKKDQDPQ